jgi:Predicted hydrolases or acyltransferases (alpha/beta hydrolase superfamily)
MLKRLPQLIPDHTVSVDGVTINYTAHRLPDARPTIILIHGFGASLETWDDLYPLLCVRNSVVRMDLKGSGFSSKPKDAKYAPLDQARLLLHLFEVLNLTNVVLVGHSLGGGIVLLNYFESLKSSQGIVVKGMILIDSAGYSQSLPFFVSAVRNPITRLFSGLMPPFNRARFVLNRIFAVKEQLTPERIHRYSFFLDMPGSRYALHQTAVDIVPENLSALSSQIPTIQIPTLIIWGQDDPVIAVTNALRFHHNIEGSQIVILDKTGHVPQEERPQETFEAIDAFLQSLK